MIRVRVHLGFGKDFRKWKVIIPKGLKGYAEGTYYHNPTDVELVLINCKLWNSQVASIKIFKGSKRFAVAWIECEELIVAKIGGNREIPSEDEISFNPKIDPFWVCEGEDVDGKTFKYLRSKDRKIYK